MNPETTKISAALWYYGDLCVHKTVESMLKILLGDNYRDSDQKVEITMKVIDPKEPR